MKKRATTPKRATKDLEPRTTDKVTGGEVTVSQVLEVQHEAKKSVIQNLRA